MKINLLTKHFLQIVSLPNLAPGQHEQRLEQPRGPRDQDGQESFEEALEGASQVLGLDPVEVAAALQANPDIAQVTSYHPPSSMNSPSRSWLAR